MRILRAVGLVAILVAGVFLSTGRGEAADWTVTLGLEGRVLPSYPGSASSTLLPIPLFDIRMAGRPRRFTNPRDGLGIGLYDSGAFRFGITGKAQLPRRVDGDPNLAGVDNVDWTLEPGLFLEYWPVDWLRTRAEVRQGIGGHHGQIGDLSADVVVPIAPGLTLSGGPRAVIATSDALAPYFGVTAAEAAASVYPVYRADGGLRSFGLGGLARYELSPSWSTHVFVEYERLAGSAANSPIVRMQGSPDQVSIGVGFTYSFDMRSPF
jgi:outer membrane protein